MGFFFVTRRKLIGKSFASRVAAGLLSALGFSELITNTEEEHEALEISLAREPNMLADLKNKVRLNAKLKPLFKIEMLVSQIESAHTKI